MSRIQFAQDAVEGAVVALTQHPDPMADQEGGADALSGLMVALCPCPSIDDLGSTGGTGVGKKRQTHLTVPGLRQDGMGGLDHRLRPILSRITEDPSRSVEHIEPIATGDVRSGPWSPEGELLRAEVDDMDIGESKELFCMSEGSTVRTPVHSTGDTSEAGAGQKSQRVRFRERRPVSNLYFGREMVGRCHVLHCAWPAPWRTWLPTWYRVTVQYLELWDGMFS
jgi:hypothetical protein